ncbi:putative L-aspartate dehydrogenase isoform X1 [Lates japonicus]|uniref:L-aspartate dehydrogenase isoform X1 n=1 Tax=Lates japonicus TaxID=270547 RepID=A0AAD3MT31_LATJO|nr:putative L-aspartate dehydrogenase isoform X1 [Lates japonicus]
MSISSESALTWAPTDVYLMMNLSFVPEAEGTHSSVGVWDYQDMATTSSSLRIGIYLVERILKDGAALGLTLAFCLKQKFDKLKGLVPDDLVLVIYYLLQTGDDVVEKVPPQIVKEFGLHFLSQLSFHGGLPSLSLDPGSEPEAGARRPSSTALFIRMSKHPSCFRRTGDALSDWTEGEGRRVLFRGPVAELCPLTLTMLTPWQQQQWQQEHRLAGVQGEIVTTRLRRNHQTRAVTAATITFWNSLPICKGHGGRVYLC